MASLENAISLAVQAHRGQKDYAGMPYITHPLRVMCRMKTQTEMMVAVLHDVVEDTHYTLDDLRKAGYPEEVVAAVDSLSRREGESYEEFIERITLNRLAMRVKLGDLEDNMDVRRNNDLTEKDLQRLNRYTRAWHRLTALLDA